MLGTSITLIDLIDTLSTPLKRQLNRLGVSFCEYEVSQFIRTNINYPSTYTPTSYCYFVQFKKHLQEICNYSNKPIVGQRVYFTDYSGQLHNDALIVAVIGQKVKISEITRPPTLSLVGANQTNQKIGLEFDENANTSLVDISRLMVPDLFNTYYNFNLESLNVDSELIIQTKMLRWQII
jgi:hypothetical protein